MSASSFAIALQKTIPLVVLSMFYFLLCMLLEAHLRSEEILKKGQSIELNSEYRFF